NQVSGGIYDDQVTIPNIPPGQLSIQCIAWFNDGSFNANNNHMVNITAPQVTAPTAPTLSVTASGSNSAHLTWTANASGGTPTSYQFQRRDRANPNSGTWSSWTNVTPSSSTPNVT